MANNKEKSKNISDLNHGISNITVGKSEATKETQDEALGFIEYGKDDVIPGPIVPIDVRRVKEVEEHDEESSEDNKETKGFIEYGKDDVISGSPVSIGVRELKEEGDLQVTGFAVPQSGSEPEAQKLPLRTSKRGRSLIPRTDEADTAPKSFVDVPDYGYVGMDGSFQVPF